MASQRFRTIFERNVNQFVGYFSEDASELYKDEKNKLIHPGEYGKYREESFKRMLRLLLNNQVAIDDGFVITGTDQITTQCDIIVYNSTTVPLITDGISRMYPAEEVRLVGEIKSTLNRKQYIDALRKIAINKKMILESRMDAPVTKIMDSKTYDTIGTFLVCSKMSFNYDDLCYEEIYEGIDRQYWHNGILSLEDGFFAYILDFNIASDKTKELLVRNKYNINEEFLWCYPLYFFGEEQILTREKHIPVNFYDKYYHIIDFFVNISNISRDIWIYEYDPVRYLGMNKEAFYAE